jgi:hypothetical protein
MLSKIKNYKEKNFNSWLEFFMTFGTMKIEDGGFLIFIYGWGGILGLVSMIMLLKFL